MTTPMDLDENDVEDEIAAVLDPSSDKTLYTRALKTLADRCREDLKLRNRLSRAELLQRLVDNFRALPSDHYDLDYEQESLRCIGNACALNQKAIRMISDIGFDWFSRYAAGDCPQKLQDLATGVLYNISAADFSSDEDDREQENPALKACFAAGVHIWLIRVLLNPQSSSLAVEDLIDMLFWISSSAPTGEPDVLPAETVAQLVNGMQQYCTTLLPEALGTLIESIVALLRSSPVRVQIASRPDANGLFSLLEALNARIATIRDESQTDAQTGDLAVLLPQASNLTWLVSDVSAEPTFAKITKLTDPLVQNCLTRLLQTSQAASSEQLYIASSLVLGNALLNMPESETVVLNRDTALVANVVDLLSPVSTSADLMHAGSGLLCILCRPRETRDKVGQNESIVPVVDKLCKHEMPQIREAGIRLLRALGRDTPSNQERLAALVRTYGRALADEQQHDNSIAAP